LVKLAEDVLPLNSMYVSGALLDRKTPGLANEVPLPPPALSAVDVLVTADASKVVTLVAGNYGVPYALWNAESLSFAVPGIGTIRTASD